MLSKCCYSYVTEAHQKPSPVISGKMWCISTMEPVVLSLFFGFLLAEQELREKELASDQIGLKFFIRESNRPSKLCRHVKLQPRQCMQIFYTLSTACSNGSSGFYFLRSTCSLILHCINPPCPCNFYFPLN